MALGEEEEIHLEMELLFPLLTIIILLERSECFTGSFMTDFSFGSYLRGGLFSADTLVNLGIKIMRLVVTSDQLELAKLNLVCAPPLSSALLYGYYWIASIVS